jgi:hypothetical protein
VVVNDSAEGLFRPVGFFHPNCHKLPRDASCWLSDEAIIAMELRRAKLRQPANAVALS